MSDDSSGIFEQPAPKRRYNSARRQAQAAETRRSIVRAARQLFAEHGYAGTTIEMLARAAGVAPETVYATFGSKHAILVRLMEVSVGGDEEPIALLDRPEQQRVLHDTEQRRQIRMFSRGIRAIMERMSPIFEILHSAAKTEPDIALLQARILDERLRGMTAFVAGVQGNGPLRAPLTLERAAETVWALTSGEVFGLLTGARGWSGAEYEAWLEETLTTLLLPDDAPER